MRISLKASGAIISMSGCTFSESGRRRGKRGKEGLPDTSTSVSRAERRSQMTTVDCGGGRRWWRREACNIFQFDMHGTGG